MKDSIKEGMTSDPISVAGDVLIQDALDIMRNWGMRHLPVTAENGSVCGLVSERDILRYLAGHPGAKVDVEKVMSPAPYVVGPHEPLSKVAKVMAENKYGCTIVAGPKGICGIFTTTDALKILAQILADPDRNPFKMMKIEDYFRTRVVA